MDNEMNVSLGLDLSGYQKSIDAALKIFNSFQTGLNDVKLGFDTSQTSELHKVFSDIRSTAVKELDKIQKRLNTLTSKGGKLDVSAEQTHTEMGAIQKQLEVTWSPKERAKLENQLETLKQKLSTLDTEILVNEDEIQEAKKEYNLLLKELQVNPLEFDYESNSLIKFNTQIDNIKNGLKRTGEEFETNKKKAKKFGEECDKVARQGSRLNLMGRVFSQMRNTIAAAINPLNLFRKGWNQIIMTDTSRFGATFRQIGENILAYVTPAFEKLAQWILNVLAYVNIFLKAVSGGKLDLFAKTAKSGKAAEKSAANINKMTAGFDEINDIGDSGGSSGSEASSVAPLNMEAEIDTKWADKLKEIGTWINKNWKAIVLGIGAVAAVILTLNIASKLTGGGLSSVGTGFSNLLSSLGTAAEIIAILGGLALVIGEISNLLQVFYESGMTMPELAGVLGIAFGAIGLAFVTLAASTKLMDWKGIAAAAVILGGLALVVNQLTGLIKALGESGMSTTDLLSNMGIVVGGVIALIAALTVAAIALSSPMAMAGLALIVAGISAVLLVVAATLPTILEAAGKFITQVAPPIIKILETIIKGIETIIYTLGTVLPPIINSIGRVWKTIFGGIESVVKSVGGVINNIFNGVAKVIDTIGKNIMGVMNTAKNLVTEVLQAILDFINQLGPAVNNFIDNMISGVTKLINFMISGVEYMVNTLVVAGINKIIDGINSVGEYVGFTIPRAKKLSIDRFVPKLDVGTNYVPQDTLAVIHQGEAVIPKEFNDRSYFGGGNEETNSLLEILIEKIDEIDFSPYIGIKDIGEASISYINKKTRTTGRSVI